jgi:integrase/recombinase XerD
MIGVTTAIVHDTRVKRMDGTYAVKLRVTYNREQKYYPVNVYLTREDWARTQSEKPRNEFKEHKLYFGKIEQRALDIIRELHPFSFEGFEKKFDQRVDRTKDVLTYLDNYIKQLSKDNRSGTADSYQCAYNSFQKCLVSKGRKRLNFGDITPEWLKEYEDWMLEKEKSFTTIGIYLRSLRTIINIAIEDGTLAREFYPFGKRKYQIPSGRNVKKALIISDIQKIVTYKTTTEAEDRARDLWLFSYLCNGANVKDIARLQYRNIDNTKITFIRAKTERTTKQDLKPIVVMLLPEIKKIIEKWGVKPIKPESYVFGIITKNDSAEEELAKVRQATKTINKYMKRIGKDLTLDINLTTYTARHSFATVLKRSGAPTEFISESLGHKDLRTTENYLDSFEDSVKESFQKQLLKFD